MEFSRQEYWSGLPCPSPGNLPDPGIEPRSPAVQADSLPAEPPGKPYRLTRSRQISTKRVHGSLGLIAGLPAREHHAAVIQYQDQGELTELQADVKHSVTCEAV